MQTEDKILITGANGLLGNRLVKALANKYKIFAIVRKKPNNPIKKVNYFEIDLSGDWSDKDIPLDIDAIIHLAQSSKFREFPDKAEDIFNVNIQSTSRLLDYAYKHNVKKFIYASSGGIYGADSKAFDENSPIPSADTLGFYLGSKLCGEILVRNYAEYFDAITLRFFFMYGPEQNQTMLIPRLVKNVKNQEAIQLQGNDGIRINPIHVTDAVECVKEALGLEGSYVFNVGGSEIYSLREIAEIIGKTINISPVFNASEDPAKDIIGNIDGMKNKLYTPQINFKTGVKDFFS